jgi:hypothetical protein
MSNFTCREIKAADEGSFCQYAGTPGSSTYTKLLPVVGNLTIDEPRYEDQSQHSRQNESRPGFRGVRRWALEIEAPLIGHLTTAAGALTKTWLAWLLGDGLGGVDVGMTGSTIASGSSATGFTMAASTGWAVGQICRVGEKADGFGDGQPGVVATLPGAHAVTLLNALPGAGEVSDKVYGTQLLYPLETLGTSKRFFVGWTDAGMQYHLLGGHLAGIKPVYRMGELASVRLTYKGAFWARSAVTVPTTDLSMESADSAPISGGTLFMQAVGTSTRAVVQPWEVDLELDLGLVENMTPGGIADRQGPTSMARTRAVPTVRLTLPITDALEDYFDNDGASADQFHLLFSSNGNDGDCHGWYMPRAYLVGPRPSPSEFAEQTAIVLTLRGREGTVITNNLTRSAIRFFMG